MKKKKTVTSCKKRADRLFSEIVRRSAADDYGWVQCVTCGVKVQWKASDAGHYESRRHNMTRFDKRNVKPQCRTCNRYEEGRKYEFGKYLVGIYGKDIIDELRTLAHTVKRFTVDELEEMITEFKKELEKLK